MVGETLFILVAFDFHSRGGAGRLTQESVALEPKVQRWRENISLFLFSKASELRKEMEEARGRRELEHLELTSGEGLELVPLMKNLGHPSRDPNTGYLMMIVMMIMMMKYLEFTSGEGQGKTLDTL